MICADLIIQPSTAGEVSSVFVCLTMGYMSVSQAWPRDQVGYDQLQENWKESVIRSLVTMYLLIIDHPPKEKGATENRNSWILYGAPRKIRTPDLLIRSSSQHSGDTLL